VDPFVREFFDERHAAVMSTLKSIADKQDVTNGRITKAEQEIVRLQERTHPWTATGVGAGLMGALMVAKEWLKK
jgi:ElaB/YqjD/DUF883 family membrane-anchored ribosome-binding protein